MLASKATTKNRSVLVTNIIQDSRTREKFQAILDNVTGGIT